MKIPWKKEIKQMNVKAAKILVFVTIKLGLLGKHKHIYTSNAMHAIP